MPVCKLCDRHLKIVTNTHLRSKHGLTEKEYKKRFPRADLGLTPFPASLSKDDPRYLIWRKSLLGRRPWNKGLDKRNSLSVKKISLALSGRRRSNSNVLVERLPPSPDLAELVGITLGDGHLRKYERTEQLCISCNAGQADFVEHVVGLVKRMLSKDPSIYRSKSENVVRISVYQNGLSQRLQLPHGNKIRNNVGIPDWIRSNRVYSIRCLKGLFETDGTLTRHKRSYTTAIEFKNQCSQLLMDVHRLLLGLGFTPQKGKNYVRLARKREVALFAELIDFRSWKRRDIVGQPGFC